MGGGERLAERSKKTGLFSFRRGFERVGGGEDGGIDPCFGVKDGVALGTRGRNEEPFGATKFASFSPVSSPRAIDGGICGARPCVDACSFVYVWRAPPFVTGCDDVAEGFVASGGLAPVMGDNGLETFLSGR